jgi:hypothetical protein
MGQSRLHGSSPVHQLNVVQRVSERPGLRAVAFGVSRAPECEPDVESHWRPA